MNDRYCIECGEPLRGAADAGGVNFFCDAKPCKNYGLLTVRYLDFGGKKEEPAPPIMSIEEIFLKPAHWMLDDWLRAKQAGQELIAERERLARIDEVSRAQGASDSVGVDIYEMDAYLEKRLAELKQQSSSKEDNE